MKKQTTRFDPTLSPTFWINHASRALMRRFEQVLRPLDFGMATLPVAIALEEDGPLLQRDLAARAWVEQPTMAALIARMERDGLIRREPHPTDRRATLLSLTEEARTRLPEAKERLEEAANAALVGLDEIERAALTAALRKVVANLGEEIG